MNAFSLCPGGLGSFIIDVKGVSPARAQFYRNLSEDALQSLQRRREAAEEIFWADKPSDLGFTAIAVDTDIKQTQNRGFADELQRCLRYQDSKCAAEVSFYLLPFSLRPLLLGEPMNNHGTLLVVRQGQKTDVRRGNPLILYNNVEVRLAGERGHSRLSVISDRRYNPVAYLQG